MCCPRVLHTHMHTTPPPSTPAPLLWWFPLDFCLFSCSDDVPYIHCSLSCVDSMYRSRPLRVMWMYNTLWLQGNKQDWKGSVERQRWGSRGFNRWGIVCFLFYSIFCCYVNVWNPWITIFKCYILYSSDMNIKRFAALFITGESPWSVSWNLLVFQHHPRWQHCREKRGFLLQILTQNNTQT